MQSTSKCLCTFRILSTHIHVDTHAHSHMNTQSQQNHMCKHAADAYTNGCYKLAHILYLHMWWFSCNLRWWCFYHQLANILYLHCCIVLNHLSSLYTQTQTYPLHTHTHTHTHTCAHTHMHAHTHFLPPTYADTTGMYAYGGPIASCTRCTYVVHGNGVVRMVVVEC